MGNTRVAASEHTNIAVHPHVRGEYHDITFLSYSILGSPPRAWGIRCLVSSMSLSCPVHPHVRGEYDGSIVVGGAFTGSPPRAWGILIGQRFQIQLRRFTPTCVGNTPKHPLSLAMEAVHPHVRGEYCTQEEEYMNNAGSPPRAWGILNRWLSKGAVFGSPPRAWGILRSQCILHISSKVHPHVRGEYKNS